MLLLDHYAFFIVKVSTTFTWNLNMPKLFNFFIANI